jgi:hypothetical protein
MSRGIKIAVLGLLVLGLVRPGLLRAESIGHAPYDYPPLFSLPQSYNPDDEELSKKATEALKEWSRKNYPGQGKMVSRAIVVGLDLYLVVSLWWSDMNFSSRLNRTAALWEFWADYYLKEGPKYEGIVVEKKDLRIFLINRKGHPLGGSHRGGEVSAWSVE